MQTENIEIYTDGSCIGNPGPGGWGAIIFIDDKKVEVKGGEKDTTNNRMEMMAIIKALEWLRKKSGLSHDELLSHKIHIHSDSNLIIQTMTQGWKRKANTDLWGQIDKQSAWLNINWNWVKAHADNHHNNEVDRIAFSQAQKYKKKS